MKTIVSKKQEGKKQEVKRVSDKIAEDYVNNFGWIYIPKQSYKTLNKKETKPVKTKKV